MLLVIKNIWSSVSPVCKSMHQVHKIMEKHWEFVWKLFCRLGILPVGGFLTLHCDTERFFSAAYPASWFVLFLENMQDVISNASFLLPWFIYLSKILCMHRWYIFSSQQVSWQSLERQWEMMVWSSAQREVYLHFDK